MHQVDTGPCNNQVQVEQSTQNICSNQSVVAPANSIATIPLSSTNRNRTYLQCYSREANKNLVSWADQMSLALRDSVAHLDQICMRVRSCLSDLEANEIRYLHMQRRPSPMELYQPAVATSIFEPPEIFAVTPECHNQEPDSVGDNKAVELVNTDAEAQIGDPVEIAGSSIEIESLPANTPVIVEPIAVQKKVKPPLSRELPKRPQSRRSGSISTRGGSASSSSRSPASPKEKAKPPKIASIKSLKPLINVRDHLEVTTSSRQVYKKIFRNKSQSADPQIMMLSTPPQISRPTSILKIPHKFSTKPLDNVKLSTLSTAKNTIKNKENCKFNDSLWFKDNNTSQAKLHDQCKCKVMVECPRVPTFNPPRASYNAQSRLQWIRAKNSLVLEYNGKQQRQAAIVNQSASTTSADGAPRRNPVDILDAINDDLVQPLKSEYPRKDNSVAVLSADNAGRLEKTEDGNELLRELLENPRKLKGLVRSSSRRILVHNFSHSSQMHGPLPTPIIKMPTSPYVPHQDSLTNSTRLHMLRKQRKRKEQQLKKKQKEDVQRRQELLLQKQFQLGSNVKLFEGKNGEAGDLMMGKSDGKRSKDAMNGRGILGMGNKSCSSHSGGREDKENAVPFGQRRESEAGYSTWSNMSPHEIKTKLMPFLIPDQRIYTVMPITEIIYDKKTPVSGLPPTTIAKGNSSAHLNSTQPSNSNIFRRVKPRSLYTDAKTQRKLDSYLELRDSSGYCVGYPRPIQPAVYTALPAVNITTTRHPTAAPFSGSHCSVRHSPYHHPHHNSRSHQANPRRQSACSQSTTSANTTQQQYEPQRGGGTTANPYHKRHCTTSGSVIAVAPHVTAPQTSSGRCCNDATMGVDIEQLSGGLSGGGASWLEKAKRAKTAISAATRRDIGSSIKQLEDKIAELISDPSKIGDGKAFDDVEQDIVRMLNKINTPQQEMEVSTTDDLLNSQISTEVEAPSNITATVSDVTIASAIDLIQTSQITDFSEVRNLKKSTEDAKIKEVPISCKSYHMGDSTPEQRKVTPVPYDVMVITSGLNQVEKILFPDHENNSKTGPYKSPRKEPAMQRILENIEPISTNKLDEDISAVGSPRRLFKIENIPEYVIVDNLNQIPNFPVTNIKKQHRDDSADSKLSLTGPELKKLKKLDGTSGKHEQKDFIVSTDNLCSIDSDQFVTPFMKVVRKYRQEETHDNFLQFLEALTQLSEDNALVSVELNNTAEETKDLSNPFYSDMKINNNNNNNNNNNTEKATLMHCTEQNLQQQVSVIEVAYVNQQNKQQQRQNCGLNEARAVLEKNDNICLQLVEYILKRCKTYIDKRLVLEYRCQTTTDVWYRYKSEIKPRGIVLRFVYTVLFAVVFMAMQWNWTCIN